MPELHGRALGGQPWPMGCWGHGPVAAAAAAAAARSGWELDREG